MSEVPFPGQPPGLVPGDSRSSWARRLRIGAVWGLIAGLTIAAGISGWRVYRWRANAARDRRFHGEMQLVLTLIEKERRSPSPDFGVAIAKAAVGGRWIHDALEPDATAEFPGRRILMEAARDLYRLSDGNLMAVSEAEVELARKLIRAAPLLDLPTPVIEAQDPQVTAALAEIERLGGVVTSDLSRPIQPVTSIRMKGDQFGDQHLEHLPNVANLDIESSKITDAGLQKIGRIRSLTGLRLTGAEVTDAGLASVAALPVLTEVHLCHCPHITDSGLPALKRVPRLVLFGSNITDQTLTVLKDFPSLQLLGLRSDSLTDEGLSVLAGFPRLTKLALDHCHELSDEALVQLAAMEHLEMLTIHGADITDLGLESLGRFPRLERLLIAACDHRMRDGLRITDAGLVHLKNLPKLRAFSIQFCPGVTDAGVDILKTIPSLTYLQLKETGITEEGHQELVSSLSGTQVEFTLAPPSPLDEAVIAAEGEETPPDQKAARCRGWPTPHSTASLGGTLTVEELETEYRGSREATDAKYDGQVVELTGRVLSAGHNLEGAPLIRLSGSDDRFELNCVLRPGSDAADVMEGDTCRLRGVYCTSVLPTFVHCTVQKGTDAPQDDAGESTAATTGSARQPPDVTLTAEQLDAEIAADFEEARRKYAGKTLQVTGRITRITHVAAGAMHYRMGPFLSTQYYLRTGQPWCCARPGETITLIGRWFHGYPCLVDCEVISVSGHPYRTMAATELGEFLEADRDRFRKWFYFRQFLVTGEVLEKTRTGSNLDHVSITLRSTKETKVVCEMEWDEFAASESVRVGDAVTITGWNTKETPTDSIILVGCLFWRGQ